MRRHFATIALKPEHVNEVDHHKICDVILLDNNYLDLDLDKLSNEDREFINSLPPICSGQIFYEKFTVRGKKIVIPFDDENKQFIVVGFDRQSEIGKVYVCDHNF